MTVIELFGYLKDTTEDHDLTLVDDSRMACTSRGLVPFRFNFAPSALDHVEAPEVIQLLVLVVLATEHVEAVVVEGG